MGKFNKEFYLANTPAVKNSDKTAFEHFVIEGWKSGALANAEGEPLNGDDIVTEAVALSGEALISLISKMSAGNMREVDADSDVLDVPALMTTNFDVFKNMDASETVNLVLETPMSLAGMGKDDFQFLETGENFDLGSAMNAFDDSTETTVLRGFTLEAFEFIESKPTYDLGAKLTAMGDENLAIVIPTLIGDQTVGGIAFMKEIDGFDIGAEITAMDDEYLVKVLKNVEFESIRNIDGFNLGAQLAERNDDFLTASMSEWSEDHLDSLLALEDFDVATRLGSMEDSSNRARVLGDWGVDSLKAMDAASDAFKISDVVFGNMNDFRTMNPDDMVGLLVGLELDEIKGAARNMSGDHLAFLDSASNFDLGLTMGTISDSLFADLTSVWDPSSLVYLEDLSSESKHIFDMESRLTNLEGDDLIKVLDNEQSWSLLDEMESFDLDDKLEGLQEESYTKILSGLDEGSFDFLDKKKGFNLNTKLESLNEDNLTDVLKSLNNASYEFLDKMEDFDLDNKLESLDDDNLMDVLSSEDAKIYLRNTTTLSNTVTSKINSALSYLDNNKSPEIKQEILEQTFIKSLNQPEYSYDTSETFIDTTDDKLTYSAQLVGANDTKALLPSGWEINPVSGILTGKPTTDDDLKIEVTAKDKGGKTVSDIFSVNVTLPTNEPFTILFDVVKARDVGLPSNYGLAVDEDLIKLTLAVDMAGITQPELSHFESVSGAELDVVINWDEFETLDASTGKQYHFAPIASSTPIFQAATANAVNGFDRLTVSSLDVTGSLSLVDQLDGTASIGSQLDLSTIYLNPLDTLVEVTVLLSGLVIGNEGTVEMTQPSSSFDLFF